jgi:Domain of unknown function (DUF4334)
MPLVDDQDAAMPIAALIRSQRLLRPTFVPRLFSVVRPLLCTHDPKARLRLTVYRGVLTATLCYDALPTNDVFRKVAGGVAEHRCLSARHSQHRSKIFDLALDRVRHRVP